MKLLIITQRVEINDDVLGFFHGWLLEFAKHCEKLTVICLEKGEFSLPDNVEVLSLGKEGGESRLKYVWRFYKYIFQKRGDYDKVFVHMNTEYAVLGGLFWRLGGKEASLWYVHKAVSYKLRLGEKFMKNIFTAGKDSCRINSRKIKIVGHGIDVKKFTARPDTAKIYDLIYVGRISQIKNQKLLIRAVDILVSARKLTGLKVGLIGRTITEKDQVYLNELKLLVEESGLCDNISFVGAVPNMETVKYYNQAKISVNLCPTGGVDKAVLESMACEIPVIAFNKAFREIFGERSDLLLLDQPDEEELAGKILRLLNLPAAEKISLGQALRKIIVEKYSLENLIKVIIRNL